MYDLQKDIYSMKRTVSLLLAALLISGILLVSCKYNVGNVESSASRSASADQSEDADVSPQSDESSGPEPDPRDPRALELLDAAFAEIDGMTDLAVDCSVSEHWSFVSGDAFLVKSGVVIEATDYGSEDMVAAVSESNGYYRTGGTVAKAKQDFKLFYDRGEVFLHSNVLGDYSADEDAAVFTSRWLPPVPVSADNYDSVRLSETEGNTVIVLGDAVAPEAWIPVRFDVIEQNAEVALDGSGSVDSVTLDLRYRAGCATVTAHYVVKARALGGDVTADSSASDYKKVDTIDMPLILDTARIRVGFMERYSAGVNVVSVSQAGAIAVVEHSSYDVILTDSQKSARLNTRLTILDNAGNSSEEYYEERFADGTRELIGGDPTGAETVEEAIVIADSWILTDLLYDKSHYTPAQAELVGDYFAITLTGSLDHATAFFRPFVQGNLFENDNAVDSIAQSYRSDKLDGYLSVDADTLLPAAYSVNYQGAHTIDGADYILACNEYVSLIYGSYCTYENIFDSPAPDAESRGIATPAFYKVSDSDGNHMWLLGTIHVGDNRTSNLPKELYEAFDAADVFAVEIDLHDFDSQIENDPQLLDLVRRVYYLSDTTIDNKISEELLDSTISLTTALGTYSDELAFQTPFLISSMIGNRQLERGSYLSYDQGVEERLSERAYGAGKEVISIEEAEPHIGMSLGYSDRLNELLLEEAVYMSRGDNCFSSERMFELWCSGDEDALREFIARDEEYPEEISEDDKKEYDLYVKLMETDRNELMLQAAKDFIAGDKTVFCAVGAAHLFAEDGLLNTLAAAGYTVERVEYASAEGAE